MVVLIQRVPPPPLLPMPPDESPLHLLEVLLLLLLRPLGRRQGLRARGRRPGLLFLEQGLDETEVVQPESCVVSVVTY